MVLVNVNLIINHNQKVQETKKKFTISIPMRDNDNNSGDPGANQDPNYQGL